MSNTYAWRASVLALLYVLCAACGSSRAPDREQEGGISSTGSAGNPSASTGHGGSNASAGAAGAVGVAGAMASGGSTVPAGGNGSSGVGESGGDGGVGSGTSTGSAGSAGETSGEVRFESNHIAVTGVRGTATPAAATVVKLKNFGASALQVTDISLAGANAALFKIGVVPAVPVALAGNAELSITVEMSTTGAGLPADLADKNDGCVLLNGTLKATTNVGDAVASVHGLLLAKVNYEPTLGQILTSLGYALDVGKAQNNWNPNTSMDASTLPGLERGTDEVAASRFVKAGGGSVNMTLVARFSPVGPLPYGWYTNTTGCTSQTGGGGCTLLATMANVKDAQTSDKARMVKPPIGTGNATFDPGDSPFGIWIYTDQKTHRYDSGNAANGDFDYSEDALNSPSKAHRFKTYPLKDAAGTSIAGSYLLAVEEAGNGDYQDYVFLLSNVQPVP